MTCVSFFESLLVIISSSISTCHTISDQLLVEYFPCLWCDHTCYSCLHLPCQLLLLLLEYLQTLNQTVADVLLLLLALQLLRMVTPWDHA